MLDQATRQSQFPSLSEMTYLNTAAEGIPPLAVHGSLDSYWQDKLLGMSGREAHFATLESARAQTAAMFGMSTGEVSICSCSSEAYNLLARALRLKEGDEVIINDLDFPAGATPWLSEGCLATVRVWRSRSGALRTEDLAPLVNNRTRLLQTSLVSFLNGFKISLPEVAQMLRRQSSGLLAVDVTQALGRIPMDLGEADVVISSTHKWILATHGGGLVGVRDRVASQLNPHAGGWFNLEDAFGAGRFEQARSKSGASGFAVGMPNFPAVYAIDAALKFINHVGVTKVDDAMRPLVLQCIKQIARCEVELMTPDEPDHLAGIIAFKVQNLERVNARLLQAGVHVMAQQGRMRLSLHGYNTAADVERFFTVFWEAINHV